MGCSVRTDRYRYSEWRDFKTGKILAQELYDHDVDPRETVNRVDHVEQTETVKRLAEMLRHKGTSKNVTVHSKQRSRTHGKGSLRRR